MTVPNPFGNNDAKDTINPAQTRNKGLVSWLMTRVDHGRQQRDLKHKDRWAEYTRLWRGTWTSKDKNTDSERSRLVAPALQQAIEMTVSEIEEAVFGRQAWFSTEDDDQQPEDVIQMRDNLLWDFNKMHVEDALSNVFLLGAIYGTGIAKLNVVRHKEVTIGPAGTPATQERPRVKVDAIRPDEFVIDPSATSIDEALFCAHEIIKPLHTIKEKQAKGIYRQGTIGTFAGTHSANTTGTGSTSSIQPDDNSVLITEYYGRVPARLLKGKEKVAGMIEAIVVVANGTFLLKAVESPFTMQDRPIVAYQHDSVPGEFWGRGVAEKGYNPQKALDAELRARVDALALMTAPMMGADITRLGDRYAEFKVRPGKTVFTRGRPSEVYEPVAFGNPAQLGATFQQSGDLERMVQMGTGAMDSATPTGQNRRNETSGGMSQIQSGFLKRAKRTMQNLERQFLDPLIRKSLWRYIQFDPDRYPKDYEFRVHSAMGIMAKEVENQNLVQMLGFTPPDSPAHGLILTALFENIVSIEKKALLESVKAMNAPPSEEEQQLQKQVQELQMRAQQADVAKTEAEVEKLKAEAALAIAKREHELVKSDLEDDLIEIQAANAVTGAEKARITRKQTEVAAERNDIEREKVRKGDASTTTSS